MIRLVNFLMLPIWILLWIVSIINPKTLSLTFKRSFEKEYHKAKTVTKTKTFKIKVRGKKQTITNR